VWLVLGSGGQVGQALCRDARWTGLDRAALDLTDPAAVQTQVGRLRPTVVVNAAAHTALDRAETDPAAACAVNATGAQAVAKAAAAIGACLIQISTDCVFSGEGGPFSEDDPVGPINAYGASKLAGEQAVRASGVGYVILRTSWLVGEGRSNFLGRVCRQALAGEAMAVVDDQLGTPTGVADLALAISRLAEAVDGVPSLAETLHFAGLGQATRHDLAQAIADHACDLAGRPRPMIRAIETFQGPGQARRPRDARLSSIRIARLHGIDSRPWGDMVRDATEAWWRGQAA